MTRCRRPDRKQIVLTANRKPAKLATMNEIKKTIRYGRMPKGDVRSLCRGLARDVTAMRAQRPDLKVAY